MIAIIGTVVGLALGFGAVQLVKRVVIPALSGQSTSFAESDWAVHTLTDIEVEAPFAFGPGPDLFTEIPADAKPLIRFIDTHAGPEREDFQVLILRAGYTQDGHLDGAVAGAMQSAARTAGDPNPRYEVEKTQISGLDARRARYEKEVRGKQLYIDAAFVMKGPQFWQAQVIYFDESQRVYAERLLESIRVIHDEPRE